jgi:hypothetical protein
MAPYRSEQVVSASTRRSWYFHCKEQARNNGRSFLQPAVCIATLVCKGTGFWLRPRNKKPGAVSRPGGWRTFGEYSFLEDSRYTSQEDYEGNLMWRNFLRF